MFIRRLLVATLLFTALPLAADSFDLIGGGTWGNTAIWQQNGSIATRYPGSLAGTVDTVTTPATFYTVTVDVGLTEAVTMNTTCPSNTSTCVVDVTNGILKLTGASSIGSAARLKISGGGTVANSGTLTFASTSNFDWTNGSLSGAGTTTIATGANLNASGTSMKVTGSQILSIAGTMTYGSVATGLEVNSGAKISVQNGGVVDIQNSSGIASDGVSTPTIDVLLGGVLRKTAGAFGTNIVPVLNNHGTVQTDVEKLVLVSGAHSGTFNMNGATTGFEFSGTPAFQNGTAITGTGSALLRHVTITGNVSATNISIDSFGSIGGSGTLTLSGTFGWRASSVSGITLNAIGSAAINITGENNTSLAGAAHLNNEGTFTINPGATFSIVSDAHITNGGVNGGTLNIAGDLSILSDGAPLARIDNIANGSINKTAGAGAAQVNVKLNNAGSVSSLSGLLKLQQGGTHSGSWGLGTGAGLVYDGGTHQFTAGSFSGSTGTIALTDGVMDVDASMSVPSGIAFQQSGGTLTGAGNFTVNGSFLWTGGTMDNSSGGGQTILTGTNSQLASTTSTVVLSGRTISQTGTFTYNPTPGIELSIDDGGVFLNTGSFNLVGDAEIDSNQSGTPRFTNGVGGAINKSTGTGIANIYAYFSNNSSMNLSSGSIALHGGGQDLGTVNFGGATNKVIVDSCVFGIATSPTFNGGGVLTVTGVGARLVLLANLSIGNLELLGGQIDGTGALAVTTSLVWQSGSMVGPGTTSIGNLATVDATSLTDPISIDNRTFQNNGTFNWDGSVHRLALANGAIFNNNGTFNAIAHGNITSAGATNTINNAGTFRKSGGTSGTRVDAVLANSGTVSSEVGGHSLIIAGGGSQTGGGTLSTSAGALLDFFGGTFTVPAGTSPFSGSGTFRVNGGTLAITGSTSIPSPATLVVESGVLDVATSSTFQVFNQFQWTGGTLQGGGTTRTFGGLIGNAAPTTLANDHTLTIPASSFSYDADNVNYLTIGGTANLNVETGGSLSITGNGIIGGTSTDGVTVAGALTKIGTGTARIDVPLIMSSGTAPSFGAAGGTLQINGGGSSLVTAAIDTGTSGIVDFSGGTFATGPGTTINGSGTIRISGGTLQADGALTIPNFLLDAGALAGTGNVTVNAGTWNGGTIGGTGAFAIAAGATLDIGGANGVMALAGRTITNAGTINYVTAANPLSLTGGADLINNGTFTFSTDQPLNAAAGSSFTNDGTFTKNAGAATAAFGAAFTNNNIVTLASGETSFDGGYTQDAGSTTLAGGNLASPLAININGGLLTGDGTITGQVISAATVAPGASPGSLTIAGDYTQTASGTLAIELGGTTAGTGYDVLAVSGNAALDGMLDVSFFGPYMPVGGETYDVLTFAAHSGDFATKNLPTFPAGGSIDAVYVPTGAPTALQLQATLTQADVSIAQSIATPANVGQPTPITITITNNGPSVASDVALSESFTGATFVSVATDAGSCSGTGPISCTIGALAPGQSATVTVTVAPSAPGTVSSTATVSTSTFDPNTANDGPVTSSVPVNAAPAAADDAVSTSEDTGVTFDPRANDSDADGDPLTITGNTAATNGAATCTTTSCTYTPNVNFHGTDSFTYTISDGQGATATATVTMTVNAVNDAPVANDDTLTTAEDTAGTVAVVANDSDVDGDPLAVTAKTDGTNGTVSCTAANCTYTPNANFNGADSFTYTISDGNGGTATATVNVTVTPVNDPPLANGDAATTAEDTAVTLDPRANDTDADGDPLAITGNTAPANGTATCGATSCTYTPNANFNGTDSFTYTISDGNGGTATATVTITVSAINDPPVANDDVLATPEDTPASVNVLANDSDVDGDALSVSGSTDGAKGTVSCTAGVCTYSPLPDKNGTDSFTYTISDGNGGTATATVTVTITPVNDAPLAVADAANVTRDGSVTVNVLANDSDPDFDPLTLTAHTNPPHGFVSCLPNGDCTYSPGSSASASDSFTYTVSDGNGGTATATVTIQISCVAAPNDFVPRNGATGVATSGRLIWNHTGASSFTVYLGAGSAGCRMFAGTTTDNVHVYEGLAPATTYSWRVEASAPGCPLVSSQCVTFTTAGATCTATPPQNLSPAGGTLGSPITFTWSAVDGATGYRVVASVAGAPEHEVGTSTSTSLTATLAGEGTVVWRVIALAVPNCGDLASQPASISLCNVPQTPLARVVGQNTSAKTYAVEWDAVPGAIRYEIDEATNPSFAGASTTVVTALSHSYKHEVETSTAFYYRVRAFNACSTQPGAYSIPVRVVIVPLPPKEAPPSRNVSVPVGTTELVVQEVFIPGEAGQTLFFSATTDRPWLTVRPASGVLPPEGVTLEVIGEVANLPNGTFTATVIVTITEPGSGAATNAGKTTAVPVSINLVTPVSPVASKDAPSEHAMIIPSVGHLDGINSHWQSDVRITNAGFRAYRYRLTFTPAAGTAQGVKQTTITVDAGATTALDDIIRNWFGVGALGDGANGMLEILPLDDPAVSSLATVASSRTYNLTSDGTLGQFVPAIRLGRFIGKPLAGALPQILGLQQLAQSAAFRTNVGVAEATGNAANVMLRIFDGAGIKLRDVPLQLVAGEQRQLNLLLAQHGIESENARIEVEVIDGSGKVTAYASVVDNGSLDPLLVSGTLLSPTGTSKWVMPGAANLDNAVARWRTDLRVFNYGAAPQPATLTFFPFGSGTPQTAEVLLEPGSVVTLDNVLRSLFAIENSGGAIHLTTASPASLVVTGRTYNETPEGTFGQFIPAVTPDDATRAGGRTLHILQVEDSPRYRTNIGLTEVSGKPAVVELQIVLPDSKVTPVVQIPLAANEFRQFGIIRELGLGNVYNGRIAIRVIAGEGRVAAYGSVVDELTQDPTYVPAQ